MTDCIRIAMWSGPRNLSTAMMRSFGSRADSFVTDEPFYGAYLRQTGDPQPLMEQVIASMDCDWRSVARTLTGPNPAATPIWYQKHMAHHMVGPIAHHDLPGLRHAFLIRDPARVVASYAAKRVMVHIARPAGDAAEIVRSVRHRMGPRHVAVATRNPRHRRHMGLALV